MPTTDLAAAITAYLADLRRRAVAAGKASEWMVSDCSLHVYPDGTAMVRVGRRDCGGADVPLATAMAEAEAYLLRDETADLNLTLGLTADGRLPEAA